HACAVRAADSFNCSGFGKSLECGRPGSHTCFTAPRLVGVPHSALTYTLGQNEDTSGFSRDATSVPALPIATNPHPSPASRLALPSKCKVEQQPPTPTTPRTRLGSHERPPAIRPP